MKAINIGWLGKRGRDENQRKNRKKSEEYGMKVYLCLEHHREGPEAVHRNHDTMRLVQQEGQRAFHLVYPEIDFRKEFGKNYLGEDKPC